MPLEFHWVGATGNSISKYDWNVPGNWIVYDIGSLGGIFDVNPWSKATRVPEAGDTIIIGQKYHCFSPLLFGGYTGGLTHGSGSWGIAGGVTSATAGVTDGGVDMTFYTDVEASSQSETIGLASLSVPPGIRNPTALFGSFEGGNDEYVMALEVMNPHSPILSPTGAATYDKYSSKYPFPYLGGGLTGEVLKWAYTQHKTSYAAGLSAGNVAFAAANAWVGGGITGSVAAARTSTLKVRHSEMVFSRGGQTPLNNVKIVDITLLPDREKLGGTVDSSVEIDQYNNVLHHYTLRNGTVRKMGIKGDATVDVINMTASYISSDLHTTLKMDHKCVVGGMQIESGKATHRYNIWPLYFAGSVTAGAVSAVWGSNAANAPVLPFTNKIVVRQPITSVSTAIGLTGIDGSTGLTSDGSTGLTNSATPTTNLDPYIGIGRFQGGTASYATIPTLTLVSSDGGVSTNAQHSLQFIGSAKIGEVNMIGGSFVPSILLTNGANPKNTEIILGSLNISQGAKIYMNVNPDFDNLFFGGVTGTNQTNYRLIGGINAIDDSCVIYPDAGVRMVNTKIVDGIGDSRSTKFGNTFSIQTSADEGSLSLDLGVDRPAGDSNE